MPVVWRRTSYAQLILCTSILPLESVLAEGVMPTLEQVVVTGTRTEKSVLETPVRTEVISRQEIQQHHARDAKEALENLPGVILRRNLKNGYGVWLQGFDADRVLVLIDGEPLTASTGSAVDLTQIATTDIERIEVVKGATAALYGSSAMGGVINIITRRSPEPLSYQFTMDVGSYDDEYVEESSGPAERHVSGGVNINRDAWSIGASASLRQSGGFDLDRSTFESEGVEGDKGNIDLRATYHLNENAELFVAPKYYWETVELNMEPLFFPGVGNVNRVRRADSERHHTTLGGEYRNQDGGRWKGWLVLDQWHDLTQQDVIATSSVDQQRSADMELYRAELQWDKPLGNKHLLTTGFMSGYETLQQDKQEQGKSVQEIEGAYRRNHEFYIQDDILLNDYWELVPGLRLQDDSDFGFYSTPKINALWHPDWFDNTTTNIRLSYGKGYRVPNLKERFYEFDHRSLGYVMRGNRDLRPEKSDSYQLGIELAESTRYRMDASLFYNRIHDLIEREFSHNEGAIGVYNYQNITQAKTQGAETTFNFSLSPNLGLKGGLTYLSSKDLSSNTPLPYRPKWSMKLSTNYIFHSWRTHLAIGATHQRDEVVPSDLEGTALVDAPSWTQLDAKINQPIGESLTLFAGVDNIGNQHRDTNQIADSRPLSPRYIYFGFRYED